MSLQDRTLVVKNFDPEKTTKRLLKELCIQGGPVRNVVVKPDHAFVEFDDIESVGYSKALLDGVILFGRKLVMEPKTKGNTYFKYSKFLHDYIKNDKQQKEALQLQSQQQQLMSFYNQPYQQLQQQMPFYSSQPNLAVQPNTMRPPVLPMMTNMTSSADLSLFNFNTYQQSQHLNQGFEMPSTSYATPGENLQRSRSFNHNRPNSRGHRNDFGQQQAHGRHRQSWGGGGGGKGREERPRRR